MAQHGGKRTCPDISGQFCGGVRYQCLRPDAVRRNADGLVQRIAALPLSLLPGGEPLPPAAAAGAAEDAAAQQNGGRDVLRRPGVRLYARLYGRGDRGGLFCRGGERRRGGRRTGTALPGAGGRHGPDPADCRPAEQHPEDAQRRAERRAAPDRAGDRRPAGRRADGKISPERAGSDGRAAYPGRRIEQDHRRTALHQRKDGEDPYRECL